MKEMEYKEKKTFEILDEGNYCGFNYMIVSYGTHPCAYVELKENDAFYGQADYDKIPIDCHGGLTYCTHHGYGRNTEHYRPGHWIGWDYAHWGDYVGYDLICDEDHQKHFTHGILYEVKNVINQLKEYAK